MIDNQIINCVRKKISLNRECLIRHDCYDIRIICSADETIIRAYIAYIV